MSIIEKANRVAIKNLVSKTAITLSHQFADITARDAYFVLNPTELVDNLFIKVGTGYQQYINGVWEDVSAIIVELQKAKDVPLEDIENKYVAENVEDALQEVISNSEALDLKSNKRYKYSLQLSTDGQPQIKFEEV